MGDALITAYTDAGLALDAAAIRARHDALNRYHVVERMSYREAAEWLGTFVTVFGFDRRVQLQADLCRAISLLEARAEYEEREAAARTQESVLDMLARCGKHQSAAPWSSARAPEAPETPDAVAPSDRGIEGHYELPADAPADF